MLRMLLLIFVLGCADSDDQEHAKGQVKSAVSSSNQLGGPTSSVPSGGGLPPQGVTSSKRRGPSPPARKKQPYQVFYTNKANLMAGKMPYVAPVDRRDFSKDIEQKAMDALFDGPREMEKGVELTACGVTGATVSVNSGLATVQLKGACGGCGAHTVADLIIPTLKQFDSVSVVHILSPDGQKSTKSAAEDAIPDCLQP